MAFFKECLSEEIVSVARTDFFFHSDGLYRFGRQAKPISDALLDGRVLPGLGDERAKEIVRLVFADFFREDNLGGWSFLHLYDGEAIARLTVM